MVAYYVNPVALTPSDTVDFTIPNGIKFLVTVAGDIKVKFQNGGTATYNCPVIGIYSFSDSINRIYVTGTTATFTAYGYY
jgi:hypothetical protein